MTFGVESVVLFLLLFFNLGGLFSFPLFLGLLGTKSLSYFTNVWEFVFHLGLEFGEGWLEPSIACRSYHGCKWVVTWCSCSTNSCSVSWFSLKRTEIDTSTHISWLCELVEVHWLLLRRLLELTKLLLTSVRLLILLLLKALVLVLLLVAVLLVLLVLLLLIILLIASNGREVVLIKIGIISLVEIKIRVVMLL